MVGKTSAAVGLVDRFGRPVKAEVLKEEISGPSLTGVRQILSGHPEIGMTPPRLAGILRQAENDDPLAYLELAEAMEEKDLHYLSVLGTRKRAVSQLPITVEAADETPEAEADAQLVRDWLSRDTLEDELFDILDAIGKGYSVCEIIWETSASQWWPRRLIWRDPRWFQFDRINGETLRLRDHSADGADLEAFKYVVHVHKAKSGLTIRGGLARSAAWGYLFKNYTIKDWVGFAEIYGIPFRLGRYDPGASADDRKALLRALAQMGSDAAGIIPKTTDIEFVDGKGSTADGAVFRELAEYIDKQMSKAVLGQTATTDAVASGLGGGLGNVHNDVRRDIERADAKLLEATLNCQVAQPLVMLNHGPRQKYPRVRIGREESVDLKATTDAIGFFVDRGLKVGVAHARKLTRTPEPGPDEELLTPLKTVAPETPQEPTGGVGGRQRIAPTPEKPPRPLLKPLSGEDGGEATMHAATAAADPDAVDRFIGSELDGWEEMVGAAEGPIRSMLTEASSLEDARDRLIGLLDTMEPEPLAELLARGGFNARLAGVAGQALGEGEA